MDAAIVDFPYLWRFLKKSKLDGEYFDPSKGKYLFVLSDGDAADPASIISPDAFLELRIKDGVKEKHVSMIWAGAANMQKNPETELMGAVSWIAKKFDPLPKHFSFARVAYLQVLADVKNKRNNLLSFFNTESVRFPPTHCALLMVEDLKKSEAERNSDKLKVYNALVANSTVFCFKLDPEDEGTRDFMYGCIENNVFRVSSNLLHAPAKPEHPSLKC